MDYLIPTAQYLLTGFAVFLGVVAGTAVTLLVTFVLRKQHEKQQVKNLRFELGLNIAKTNQCGRDPQVSRCLKWGQHAPILWIL
jgi:hypothetical protein